jgi:flavin-binding protein dodecin
MTNVYKKIELVGTSPESFAKASQAAVNKAAESLHGMNWFEVTEMRGRIDGGKIVEYQVAMKVGLKID